MIEVRNLYKTFQNQEILKNVNLSISGGSSFTILGQSGSGKSVLIKNMIGLMTPDSGEVLYDSLNLYQLNERELLDSRKDFGFLFQHGALFDSLNILDNIVFYIQQKQKITLKDKQDIASEKLKLVGLDTSVLYKYPSELSGGMQKRVAMARAICHSPKIIFFDEPTTGLDPVMTSLINETILRIKEELNATIITITHNIESAKMISTNIAFLYQSQILWNGNQSDLNSDIPQELSNFLKGKIA